MGWFDGKTAVVPIDFSDASTKAVEVALEVVGEVPLVHVLHVAANLSVMEPGIVWEDLSDASRRENLQQAFRERFADPRYQSLHFQVEFGDPGHRIADYAAALKADLIVMPSHGRTGLQRLLIGSVAERVLRFAHCPVLVLRE